MIEDEEVYYDTEEDMFAEDMTVEDQPKLETPDSFEDVMMPFSTGSTPTGTPPDNPHYVGSLPNEYEVNSYYSLKKDKLIAVSFIIINYK